MPLRASKMNFFILGFQRLVWCPKWTPASNNSLTPILITVFHGLSAHRNSPTDHPAEHGIDFDVVLAAPAHSSQGLILRPFRPFAAEWTIATGTKTGSKIPKHPAAATFIFKGRIRGPRVCRPAVATNHKLRGSRRKEARSISATTGAF